jgi:hypothetical protein
LFDIADQLPGLPCRSGHKPVKIFEWDLGLSSCEADDLKVLVLVKDLKKRRGDRGFSRQVVLLAADSVDQGLGSSCIRVLEAIEPHA